MKKQRPKNTHGGAGRGQGKKPGIMGKKVKRGLAFSPDVIAFLATLTPTEEAPELPGASQFTEALIRKSKEFKAYEATKPEAAK